MKIIGNIFGVKNLPGVDFIKLGAQHKSWGTVHLHSSQKLGVWREWFSLGHKPVYEIHPWSVIFSSAILCPVIGFVPIFLN